MFGAKQNPGPPPGYVTTETLLDMLKMSRQNFYQAGLECAIPSWKIGRSILYRDEDAFQLRHYIETRKLLIKAGILHANHKLLDEGLWLDIFAGEYDEHLPA